jgi:hypothetical protein
MRSRSEYFWSALCEVLPPRVLKSFLGALQRNPVHADRAGFHVRNIHFYEPLPDFRAISREAVLKRREGQAIHWNWPAQREWAEKLSSFADEFVNIRSASANGSTFHFGNEMFGPLDAAVYYATVRALKPARIIEVGSGFSTQIGCIALRQNAAEQRPGRMTCIEPHPPAWFQTAGLDIELLQQPVETVPLELFAGLRKNDILFIDSTHTVKFQSDVCREFLDILPALDVGVCVQVHDIFFPYDYPPDWLIKERRAWNEQYLLEAFLAFNSDFEILLANHFLSVEQPETAGRILAQPTISSSPHQAGSFWMKRKRRTP